MSTVAIYNGFGKYETKDGQKDGQRGITLTYGGVPFWMPYKKITYIPDYTFREVDHDKTTAEQGEEGVLTYRSFRVSGNRICEELLETQVPIQNKAKGIIRIDAKDRTGKIINVYAGINEDGIEQTAEAAEVKLSESDAHLAEHLARSYKEQVIQEYFQSKRERMAGGHGRLTPAGLVKVFMEELGIKDIDALPSQNNNSSLEQLLTQVLTKASDAQKAPETSKRPALQPANNAAGLV